MNPQQPNETEKNNDRYLAVVRQMLGVMWVLVVLLIGLFILIVFGVPEFSKKKDTVHPGSGTAAVSEFWRAPDSTSMKDEEVRYGRELVAHTSEYLGPNGKVMHITNGMNCQNCHLDAGTKVFGNNYSAVASTYPKFRARSGTEENIEKRVNDCMERSLNGIALPNDSRELKAIVAYIRWVGQEVPKGVSPKGVGLVEVPFLDRAANPEKGKAVYISKCQSCHQAGGEGLLNEAKTAYTYPPLWGNNSYNTGAGLFRLSRFAGYVKANMPLGAAHTNPQLSDEEAWDVAAFVNSQPRPEMNLSKDWPDISKKPVDHPFGPFKDGFSEQQHKYGPFAPIKKAIEASSKKVS